MFVSLFFRPLEGSGSNPEATYVDCSSLKFLDSKIQNVPWISKYMVTLYYQTGTSFDDCEECEDEPNQDRSNCFWKYFTYFEKYNRFAILQARQMGPRESTSGRRICAAEGHEGVTGRGALMLRPVFCKSTSKFSSDLIEKIANYAKKRCKETLCELAKNGEWKKGWLKFKKSKKEQAIKAPWPMKLSSWKGLGFKDAFEEKCWKGPEEMPESFPALTLLVDLWYIFPEIGRNKIQVPHCDILFGSLFMSICHICWQSSWHRFWRMSVWQCGTVFD